MRRLRATCAGLVLATSMAFPAIAEQIDFDDRAAANASDATLSDEYAHVGARFVASDDGAIWDGTEGGWQIEGTRGPNFLGFDGDSYSISLHFDAPVEDFQLDVARAVGAMQLYWDYFQVTGFLEGQRVASDLVFFQDTNRWQTVSLTGPIDRVIWFGTGRRGHRYGVDNLRWTGLAPPVMEVPVDVCPGSDANRIELGGRGVVPVVLYGEPDFAVEDVDLGTLAFGPSGAAPAHWNGPHFDDVDGDGLVDMVVHHRISETGIAAEDMDACLTGETLDGQAFEGCDSVSPAVRDESTRGRRSR